MVHEVFNFPLIFLILKANKEHFKNIFELVETIVLFNDPKSLYYTQISKLKYPCPKYNK